MASFKQFYQVTYDSTLRDQCDSTLHDQCDSTLRDQFDSTLHDQFDSTLCDQCDASPDQCRSCECLPGSATDTVDVGVCVLRTVQLYHPIHGREVWNSGGRQ